MALPHYLQFTPGATKGALYWPKTPSSSTAFLVTHRSTNYLAHPVALEMPPRGHTVLAMNPRFDNNEPAVIFEDIALDIAQGVSYLRSLPGIEAIVLVGHSGGGPSVSFYQAVAEEGAAYAQGAQKLTQGSAKLENLPRADGIVFLDAHPGNGVNILRCLNPAVVDERNPFAIEASLDPFLIANGFNADGDSSYSDEFLARYAAAQSRRMNHLIARAEQMREDMRQGRHAPADDDVFTVYRARARLSDVSTSVAGGTERPQKLIRNNGRIDACAPVRTVRVPTPKNAAVDAGFAGTLQRTVRSFLSSNAIRSTNSVDGIDWSSSNNSTIAAVREVSVPVLVLAMQAHYFIRDGEMIFDNAASTDKDFAIVEGAEHWLKASAEASARTGHDYGQARRNLFDYVDAWVRARF